MNKTLLDAQFSYQSSIEESVVLIYGKIDMDLISHSRINDH